MMRRSYIKIILVLLLLKCSLAGVFFKDIEGLVSELVHLGPSVAMAADEPAEGSDAETPESEGEAAKEAGDEAPKETEAEKTTKELSGLEEKRKQLAEMESRILAEQARLSALKEEIEEKVESLKIIREEVETSLKRLGQKESDLEIERQAQEAAKIRQLVKVYTGMKPKNAGAVIDKLDIEVAKKIIMQMKGEQAGKILSYVSSTRAAEISEALAQKTVRVKP